MYRFLLSRQWVILTLLGLVMIPVMVKLGFWQLHRHEAKVAHNQLIASSLAASPEPVGRLSGVGREPADDDQFRTVSATGTYDTAHESVVRQRTAADGDTIGYYVLTPLVRKDGTAVLVNRGWIEANGDLTKFPETPAPPKGKVTVTGRMMADETSAKSGIKDKGDLPPRQVMLINSKQQAKTLHRPVVGGYVQLTDTSPKPQGKQPEQVPEPEHDSIGPHMAYAVQWWLFAAAVPVGWVVLVRRERNERREAAAGTGAAGEPPRPGGASSGAAGSGAATSAAGTATSAASGAGAGTNEGRAPEEAEPVPSARAEEREAEPDSVRAAPAGDASAGDASAADEPASGTGPDPASAADSGSGSGSGSESEPAAAQTVPAPPAQEERLSMADLTALTRPARPGRKPGSSKKPGA